MTERIGIVNYGAGNLASICNALNSLAATAHVVSTPEQVLECDRLVLPGVGAAGEAAARLRQSGVDEALREAVRGRGRPLLGICLGMQLLAETLEEFGPHRGMGWIKGRARSLRDLQRPGARIPHMGWNLVEAARANGAPGLVPTSRHYYFAHSFALVDIDEELVIARTDHHGPVVAAIQFDSVLATQFHPEKSQHAGEALLQSFLEWRP